MKIKRGEFAIQDSTTSRDINISSAWETCFRPGQRVVMSMVFTTTKYPDACCPTCMEVNGTGGDMKDKDIEW